MPRTQKKTGEKRIPLNLIDSANTKISSITHQQPNSPNSPKRRPRTEHHSSSHATRETYHWLNGLKSTCLFFILVQEWERQHHRNLSWVNGIATTWERCWCRPKPLHRSHMSQNKTRKQRDALSVEKNASSAKNISSKPSPSAVSKPKRHSPSGTTWTVLPATLYTRLTVLRAGLYSTWGRPEIPCRTDFTTTDQTSKPTKTL